MIPAIKWEDGVLSLLDQRALPREVKFFRAKDFRDITAAIRDMVVRGAPAIGIAGGYAMAMACLECAGQNWDNVDDCRKFLIRAAEEISRARPTAVNLRWAVNRVRDKALEDLAEHGPGAVGKVALEEARVIEREDVEINRHIADVGEKLVPQGARILTHCNAGALATGGYGTALGVIRKAFEKGKVSMVYADETRPFLQGARLTAWELLQDGIPVTLLVDSAAGYLMSLGKVDMVIVGADRIAANGDVANKIGTFSLACLARYNRIPFYVAAPISTFDLSICSGKEIEIEERSESEVTTFSGMRVAPEGVKAFNPAFDVTPSELIEGIITEKGVIVAPYRENIARIVK